MAESTYYAMVADLLAKSDIITKAGFQVDVQGKGADHHDLLQVKKPAWHILATDGESLGYKGIEVHYESCRPGHWVIHCELWPRQGKKQKAQVLNVPDLLDLKGEITRLIRECGHEAGWEAAHHAHLRRTREDPRDPSSLIVYTFELNLGATHTPDQFASKVLQIIDATAPIIDEIVIAAPHR